MTTEVLAQYIQTSTFKVPEKVDFVSVHKWWIKWDILYIEEKKGGPVLTIEPDTTDYENRHDHKRPDNTIVR